MTGARTIPRESIDFEAGRTYTIRADAVWLEPGRVLRSGWLQVDGGRVAGIGRGLPPAGQEVEYIDLGRMLLAPGPVDAHVHLALDLGDGLDPAGRAGRAAALGLAAVRDGGDKRLSVLSRRARIEKHLILAASGAALFAPGRYGSFLGRPVESRSDMAAAVKELAGRGVDQIKVLASGPVSLTEYGRVGGPQFSADDLVFIVRRSAEAGLEVMAHANGPEAVAMCIRAGAASVEHGYFMGRDNLARLADSATAWVPTVVPLASLAEKEDDPAKRSLIEKVIDRQVGQLAEARRLGVKTVLGTDAGSPGVTAGTSLYREMAWWRRAGYSPDDILAAATEKAADLIGRSGEIGRLTPGHQAIIIGLPVDMEKTEWPEDIPLVVARPAMV